MKFAQSAFQTLFTVLILLQLLSVPAWAQDEEKNKQPQEPKKVAAPLGKFLTVTSPVNDLMFSRVNNVALELQNESAQQDRKAFLVLEISPGVSQFHQVQGLAKFLTSAKLSNVTTIAWIPETVTGNNVVLALACNEIIMHPDASLGDIGRGKPLDLDEQQSVISLVEQRHNTKLSRALVLGMMDRQKTVLKATLKIDQATEARIVTPEELKRLRENLDARIDVETVKETGVSGKFSGNKARALDILVSHLAESRADVAAIYNLDQNALREDPTLGEAPRVSLIKIDGMIEPILEEFIKRQIHRAVNEGSNLLIFEIDSPGGFLLASEELAHVIADLDPKKVRTVAYVPHQALSGAAIIALGCDDIILTPDAHIGDAGPIQIGEGGQFEHAPEKILSDLRVTLKTLAKKKNRPQGLCEAMADKDLLVYRVTHRETGRVWYMTEDEIHNSHEPWEQGEVVSESREDNLLTVDGERAHQLKIAEAPVADMEDLKQRLGIPAETKLIAVKRTWIDTTVYLLNSRAATVLLFMAGAFCIYLELATLTGFFGILSAVCFSTFFWSRFLGGTAGWLEVVLFVLGLACIALEIFVVPGFGVFGVSGGLLLLVSLIMASQTFGDIAPPSTDYNMPTLTETLGTFSASIVAVVILAMFMSRFLPQMPVLNKMILQPPGGEHEHDPDEPRLRPDLVRSGAGFGYELIGHQGKAVSMLRPSGKIDVDGHYIDVVSDGSFISAGTQVEVIEVEGNRIVVREVT